MKLYSVISIFLIAIVTGAGLSGPDYSEFVDAADRLRPGAPYGCAEYAWVTTPQDLQNLIGTTTALSLSLLGIGLLMSIITLSGCTVLPHTTPVQFEAWWGWMRAPFVIEGALVVAGFFATLTQVGLVLEVSVPSENWMEDCLAHYMNPSNNWEWSSSLNLYVQKNNAPDKVVGESGSIVDRPGFAGAFFTLSFIVIPVLITIIAGVAGYAALQHEIRQPKRSEMINPGSTSHTQGQTLARAGLTRELMNSTHDDHMLFMSLEAAGITGPAERLQIINWARVDDGVREEVEFEDFGIHFGSAKNIFNRF